MNTDIAPAVSALLKFAEILEQRGELTLKKSSAAHPKTLITIARGMTPKNVRTSLKKVRAYFVQLPKARHRVVTEKNDRDFIEMEAAYSELVKSVCRIQIYTDKEKKGVQFCISSLDIALLKYQLFICGGLMGDMPKHMLA